MTKKRRSSEIFAGKMEILSEKVVILLGEKFFRPPQTWRQVSATALWCYSHKDRSKLADC